MNSGISGLPPLRVSFAVGTSLRGSAPDASMSSLPTEPIGVHILSHTVNRKVVSTFDFASVSRRAVVAMRIGSPDCSAARHAASSRSNRLVTCFYPAPGEPVRRR